MSVKAFMLSMMQFFCDWINKRLDFQKCFNILFITFRIKYTKFNPYFKFINEYNPLKV